MEHMVFTCPFAKSFWAPLGIVTPEPRRGHDGCHAAGAKSPGAFMLLCGWELWKRCNNVVFRQEESLRDNNGGAACAGNKQA